MRTIAKTHLKNKQTNKEKEMRKRKRKDENEENEEKEEDEEKEEEEKEGRRKRKRKRRESHETSPAACAAGHGGGGAAWGGRASPQHGRRGVDGPPRRGGGRGHVRPRTPPEVHRGTHTTRKHTHSILSLVCSHVRSIRAYTPHYIFLKVDL